MADDKAGQTAGNPSGTSKPQSRKQAEREERRQFRRAEEKAIWQQLDDRAEKAVVALKAKRGRPTKYSEALGEEICERLSNGQSLRSICDLEHMPSMPTVRAWVRREASFLSMFTLAREEQAHALFDDCIDIADDATQDVIVAEDGSVTSNPSAVARAKLRIETRLRCAAKLAPRAYSDRLEAVQAGQINVQVNAVTIDARQLDADQRGRLRELLLSARPED
jgi:hypothetical protein